MIPGRKHVPDDESKNPAPADTPDPSPHDALFEHRFGRFRVLGFDVDDARILANARADSGWYLDWADVKKALDAGCSHHHAVLIYA